MLWLAFLTCLAVRTYSVFQPGHPQQLIDDGILEPISLKLFHGATPERFERAVREQARPNPRGIISIDGDRMNAEFWALGQLFHCVAARKATVLSGGTLGVTIYESTGPKHLQLREKDLNLFEGHLVGDDSSQCYGYVGEDGRLSLTIESHDEMVFVEPSAYFFDEFDNASSRWHNNVVYRGNDMISNEDSHSIKVNSTRKLVPTNLPRQIRFKRDVFKYNIYNETELKDLTPEDMKRRARKLNGSHMRIRLTLHSSVYRLYYSNEATTIGEVLSIYTLLDKYFRKMDYDEDGKPDNMGGHVVNITLMKKDTDGLIAESYVHNETSRADGIRLLTTIKNYKRQYPNEFEFFSMDHYVLYGSMFPTGIAYIGGLCDRTQNLVVVTLKRPKQQYKSKPAQANTILHECLHLMKAKDVYAKDECAKRKGRQPYFIDYGFGFSHLDKIKAAIFSDCNKQVPRFVLKRAPFGMCFVPDKVTSPYCGNMIVEEGEECDSNHPDKFPGGKLVCCAPPIIGTHDAARVLDKPCKLARLKYNAVCDLHSSPCCTRNCQVVKKQTATVCSPPTECRLTAYCDGLSAKCPLGDQAPDGTPCGDGARLCWNGTCQSICDINGLQNCDCDDMDPVAACEVCCVVEGTDDSCVEASSLGERFRKENGEHYLKPEGAVCGIDRLCYK